MANQEYIEELRHILKVMQKPIAQLVLIVCITILVYLNALPNQFVLDDESFIRWPLITDLKYIPAFFTGTLPQEHLGDYRPLKGVILALNYFFWKDNPVGYIIQGIAIHLSAVMLVYLIAKKLVNNIWTSFITALVFALHPVQVEAIVFITSSSDMVGIVFYFLAFLTFLKISVSKFHHAGPAMHVSLISRLSPALLTVFSITFFLLGLLTYEMVLTLPILIMWYLIILEKKSLWLSIKIVFPYFIVLATYMFFRFFILKVSGDETYPWGNFLNGFYLSLVALWRYAQLLIIPLRLQINHEIMPGIYSFRGAEIHPLTPAPTFLRPDVITAGLLVLGMTIFAIKVYRKYPIVTFCLGWLVITLSPVLNLYPIPTLMAERYLYLASVGFALFIGWGGVKFLRSLRLLRTAQRRMIALSGLAILLIFYGVRTYIRISDWRDSETLWTKEVKNNPRSLLANHNLGMAYFKKGQLNEALARLKFAADHNWQSIPKVHLNLGKAYLANKELQKAQAQFQISVLYNPACVECIFYLANSERELGNLVTAEALYLKALTIDEKYFDASMQLSKLYLSRGKAEAAIEQMQQVIAKNPLVIPAYYDLAAIYLSSGNRVEARRTLIQGLSADPQSQVLKDALRLVTD